MVRVSNIESESTSSGVPVTMTSANVRDTRAGATVKPLSWRILPIVVGVDWAALSTRLATGVEGGVGK